MGSVGDSEVVTIACTEHDQILSSGIRQLLDEEYLVDATLTFNDASFKVHRLILAVFLPTLKEHMIEVLSRDGQTSNTCQVLSLDYVASDTDDVRALIEFVYSGKVNIVGNRVEHLRRLANDLNIESLVKAISDWESNGAANPLHADGDTLTHSNTAATRDGQFCEDSSVVVSDNIVDDPAGSQMEGGNEDLPRNGGADGSAQEKPASKVEPPRLPFPARRKSARTTWKSSLQLCGKNTQKKKLLLRAAREKVTEDSGDDHEPGGDPDADHSSDGDMGNNAKTMATRKCPARLAKRNRTRLRARSRGTAMSTKKTDSDPKEKEAVDRFCQQVLQTWEEVKAVSKGGGGSSAGGDQLANARSSMHKRKSAKRAADLLAAMSELPTCDKCDKKFLTDRSLENHLRNCGKQREYVCRKCGHRETQREALRQHVKESHKRKREYKPPAEVFLQCPRCPFSCNAKYKLRAHILRRHTAEREHKCPECEYSAMYKGEIERHVSRTHRNEKRFVCDMCGIRYQMRGGLNRHVMTKHQGLKPYKCEYCRKEYTNLHTLKLHVQTKHTLDVQKHVCHVCGNTYIKRWGLQYHMRRAHGMSLEPLRKPYAPRNPAQDEPMMDLQSSEFQTISDYVNTTVEVFPSTLEAIEAINAIA